MNKLKFAAGASILVGTVFGCAATADATKPAPDHKVTVCHSGNGKHFTEIELDYKGALGHAKTDDDDIIPAFLDFPGQNLDKENPCSIQVTSTTQTTLIMSMTTVPQTTVTTRPTTTTTRTEVTTTWLQTTSTTRPVTTKPVMSTSTSMSPVTATTAPSSTLPVTTKAPATSVSPTTASTSITVTSPQTPAMEPTTSLPPSLSPSQQPEQIVSLPVTGNNPWLLGLTGVVLVLFGMTLLKRSKHGN